MNIQQIIEHLLRSRLYRTGVVIRTDLGESSHVLVQDVCYEGSKSFVVVADQQSPDASFCIPLARIRQVRNDDEAA